MNYPLPFRNPFPYPSKGEYPLPFDGGLYISPRREGSLVRFVGVVTLDLNGGDLK